jgi:uncharacterized membrane protein SirB2
MTWRHIVLVVVGVVLVLLGGLWLLQGANVVHVRPILCVTNCKPITGGSAGWLVAGIVGVLLGLGTVAFGLRHRQRRVQ